MGVDVLSRRRYLGVAAAVATAVAGGCSELDSSSDDSADENVTNSSGDAEPSTEETFADRLPSVGPSEWPQFGLGAANRGHHGATSGPAANPTGEKITRFEPTFLAALTIADGTIYASDPDAGVRAFDATTGSEEWSFPAAGEVAKAPIVHDGTVFAGDDTGVIYAIDANDGSSNWEFEHEETYHYTSPLTLHDGTLYAVDVAGSHGGILAASTDDGTVEWYRDLPDPAAVPVAIGEDVLVACTEDKYVKGYGLSDAEELWEGRVYAEPTIAPAIDDGAVFVAAGADVTAFDTAGGAELWTRNLDEESVYGPIGIAQDHVVVATTIASGTGWIKGLDRTSGSTEWTYETGDISDGGLAIADGTVYAGERTGTLHAIEASSGTEQWTIEPADGGAIRGTPAIADEHVYTPVSILSGESGIYAVGPE